MPSADSPFSHVSSVTYAMMVPNLNVSNQMKWCCTRKKEHNYVMHYLCRNEEFFVMFHASKSVAKHDNREYTINKLKTCSMYIDARFDWCYVTDNGTTVKSAHHNKWTEV